MKTASRNEVKKKLLELLGQNWFLRTTEEFDRTEGGLWTTNERPSEVLDGGTISTDYVIHPKVQAIMDECGWFVEHYDGGTLMIHKAS